MGKSSPTPPAIPDYTGAATAQGAANLAAGQQTASLSNPNIVSPYGNQTVTYGATGPNGDMQPTVTQTLNPDAQAALIAQQKTQSALGGLALQGVNQASSILGTPFQYTGPGIQTSLQGAGSVNLGPAPDAYGLAGSINPGMYGSAQQSLDLSNVAKMPVNAGTTGQQAILSRLNPQINQNNQALTQQLANQGITPGSEAYNNAMRTNQQGNNDLYTQAALQGINLDTAANQQGYNQALSSAGLYNSGLGQNFGQGLAAQNQANAAVGQNFGQAATSSQLYNQAQNQQYNQNLQSAQFGNTAANQSLAQQLQLYNQPLNAITALMSGSQIQNPQFQQYSGTNVAAAPVFQGVQAQDAAAQNIYGQQMASNNAVTSAIGGLLGAGASFIPGFGKSDIRLKSNIVRVGTHPLGVGVYEYDLDGHRERGVMAQEVMLVRPEAVAQHPDGYLMVNYGGLD